MSSQTTIGQAIRIQRVKAGLTLQQLGETLGVSRASLSKIELSNSVTYKKLCEVGAALGVKPSEIVRLTETTPEAHTVLRDVVECGYLTPDAFEPDEDGSVLFDDICAVLGEEPDVYKEKIGSAEQNEA